MIQLLANRYQKLIGYLFLYSFYFSIVLPLHAGQNVSVINRFRPLPSLITRRTLPKIKEGDFIADDKVQRERKKMLVAEPVNKVYVGGPTQPEMSSFKSVGTDKMVNLFTGDFSYNIPLLDVGGYPVNIFYSGGITMEQEASWVGLGWNINPGTINRNMRGVPDDFNGQDTLIQTQVVKPNITVGGSIAGDMEIIGIKNILDLSAGVSAGISVNNYLGPAVDLGVKGGVSIKVAAKVLSEKGTSDTTSFKVGVGLGADLSSRYGLTLSPSVSMTAVTAKTDRSTVNGLSLATSYNSRTGIKALQISEQMSFNQTAVKDIGTKDKPELKQYSSSMTPGISASTISFVKPSYVPSIRLPVTNEAYSGHFQLGAALDGFYPSGEIEVYKQTSMIAVADRIQKKPLIGYLYYEKAKQNPNAVMDFTRFNDKEVTSKTTVVSAPQYCYDVFSIQGEGTGGDIRAYRNDFGYVRDNYTRSQDKSLGIGADVGIPGHFGVNVNNVKTPATIGEWSVGNKLRDATGFKQASQNYENVYFRNPGETSVLDDQQYDKIGGTDLVRFKLGGSSSNPTIEPILERLSKSGTIIGNINIGAINDAGIRKKRTQVINFLNAEEASNVGLDKKIRSYDNETILNADKSLKYDEINRVSDYRKSHHISQINVTEADGKRYIYGIPVYNIIQKDFTFSVDSLVTNIETGVDLVSITSDETGVNSHLLNDDSKRDGYLQITETPAYAHSFLLSGLLSADYVDVTGNGITDDDLGNAVKFNYTRVKQSGNWANQKWRTPLTSKTNIANFNAGNNTEVKDDKGIISYGERETWYTHSIESKTMIAIFTLDNRDDGKGTVDTLGGINTSSQSMKRLKKIDLYNKADLKVNGIAGAKPIKTVHFGYSYHLCKNTPDNGNGLSGNNGKLTLDTIYFTFNGQARVKKNQYIFSYANSGSGNPDYAFAASDKWGSYKPSSMNPQQMKNANYPYSIQDKTLKTTLDQNAAAWSLNKVLLPSGGQIEVAYETDDYSYVQNKRAADMMEIIGFGDTSSSMSNRLYNIENGKILENDYVFIKIPEACASRAEILRKYLQGVTQLAFKMAVNMPKGIEYVMSYATIADYNIVTNDSTRIWIRLNEIDGLSPLSLTAIEYLREQLPGQAFPDYDVSESASLSEVGNLLVNMLSRLSSALKDPLKQLRSIGMAQTVVVNKSFVRLNDPDGFKYGGGQRVKSIILKDNWQAMTGQYTSVYGQQYDYTTTETNNGISRSISSGVASYEPSIGGEENPFQTIIQVANSLPLGPTSYGAIEMPVLDAFFPAPLVGYSKVTVRALQKNTDTTKKTRSGIGKQVTEFYTAKDFPVYYNNTSLDPSSEKTAHSQSLTAFFYKYAFDSRALSQGFVIETNDMHGKMKSQTSYAVNDEKTPVNTTQNYYSNTGANGLSEKFQFVQSSNGGVIKNGNMGIDIELMTDTREFSVKSQSLEIEVQVDLFEVILPVWLPFIWPVSGNSENTYRAVTTTKVINYHCLLDSVVVMDKGSKIATKNLAYDAETGSVVVNRTNNEFDKPIYSTSYPAYWAYGGMGLAYKNIDAVYSKVNFMDGKITNPGFDFSIFESGDELYLSSIGTTPAGCGTELVSPDSVRLIWALDKQIKSFASLNNSYDLVFMDGKGKPYTKDNVTFRIVRSGKRNMLSEQVGSAITMVSPIVLRGSDLKLVIDSNSKTINGSAVEYREKWQTDNDIIKRYGSYDSVTCTQLIDCNGSLEKSINPFRKGLIGNYHALKSFIYYGDRTEKDASVQTNLAKNGFINNFKLYWDFNNVNKLAPDVTNNKWLWNSMITLVNSRGLELETKDALNIYTAAQYGFNKTLPVAITNNARLNEMANEGFEDKGYNENLNNNEINNCAIQHAGFATMAGATVINAQTANFSAHSGNYVLGIAPGVVTTQIPVKTEIVDSFNMRFGKDTTKTLNDMGGNFHVNIDIPDDILNIHPFSFSTSRPEVSTSLNSVDTSYPTYEGFQEYSVDWDFYFKITEAKTYSFQALMNSTNSSTADVIQYINGINVQISNLNGDSISNYTLYQNFYSSTTGNYNVFLCPGIYHVKGNIYETYRVADNSPYSNINIYNWKCTNSTSPSYKSVSTLDGCISTTPIAASDSMLNPTFTIPLGKKMVFSAWVKENCDAANGFPCFPSTYSNNQVEIEFNAGTGANVILKPSGAIIEGWQRYEGYFTAPVGATAMNMRFRNTNNQMIYFDDIRVHPFNANMKTYVYDPVNLRLKAELDANNYASFYEYDEEGGLIRTKAETKEGIKTIQETRSARQKGITSVQ